MSSESETDRYVPELSWRFYTVLFAVVALSGYAMAEVLDSFRPPYLTWKGHLVVGLVAAVFLTLSFRGDLT